MILQPTGTTRLTIVIKGVIRLLAMAAIVGVFTCKIMQEIYARLNQRTLSESELAVVVGIAAVVGVVAGAIYALDYCITVTSKEIKRIREPREYTAHWAESRRGRRDVH